MIYYLSGPDDFSLRVAVQKLLQGALPPDTLDLNLTRLSGAEVTLDALRFASEAAPFLADRRAVVVEHAFARAARPARGGAKQREGAGVEAAGRTEGIVEYLPRVPSNTLLIFVEPEAPPKTGALAKALTEAQARLQHFPILAGMPLVRWIKGRAKDIGGSITDEAAQLLAGFVGGDLRVLANEVDKLATYAGPGQAIDVADVEALVSQASEASIFACVDAVAQGDRRAALSSLAVLLEGGEKPERVLALVARQVRLLLQARDLSMRGEDQEAIGRALGVPPYPLRKVLDQMRLFQVETLEGMLRRVLEADVQVKTGELESRLALELLIAELCAAGRERGRRPVGPERRSREGSAARGPGAFSRAPAGGAAVRRGPPRGR
jgi:DNA polymerase-3 subunit delta